MLQPYICVPIHSCSPRRHSSFLPHSSRHRLGNPGPAAAGGRPQAKASAPTVESVGSPILGNLATVLVPLGRGPGHCETRDRGWLASSRISAVLEVAVTSAWW